MLTYCVKQRKKTRCVPVSETFVITKNGRNAMKCQCAECGITKFRFLSQKEIIEGDMNVSRPIQGSGFDELIVKGLAAGAKGLVNLGKRGVSQAIKSDAVRDRIKSIGRRYLHDFVDTTTDSVSKKIAGNGGTQSGPSPKGVAGKGVDIHKAIGKLPKPKSGWMVIRVDVLVISTQDLIMIYTIK